MDNGSYNMDYELALALFSGDITLEDIVGAIDEEENEDIDISPLPENEVD